MRNRTTKSITARLRTLGAAPANVLQPKHSILSADPTRTTLIRQSFSSHIKQVFDSLKVEILKRIGDEDWLGLTQASHEVTPALNAFCPTGEGGGQDNSCSSKGHIDVEVDPEEGALDEVFGVNRLTKEDVANLAGAIEGSQVVIYVHKKLKTAVVEIYHPDYTARRTIHQDHISCDTLYATKTRRGLGVKIFSKIVDTAAKIGGFDYLITDAVGHAGGSENGYYTWPRFGYDAKLVTIPGFYHSRLQQHIKESGAVHTSDLMKTEEGRALWKLHGNGFVGTFDLSEGSLSRRVLDAYRTEKAKRSGATTNADGGGRGDTKSGVGRGEQEEYKAFVVNGEVGYFPPPPIILDWVADVRQRDHFSCGAASVKAVADGLISQGVLPEEARQTLEETKRELGTDVEESTRPEAIVDYFAARGLGVETFSYGNLSTLDDYLQRGWPVITPVQDYGPEVPRAAVYDYGHYLTVIGHGLGYVFSQDSSEDNVVAGGDNKELSETGSIQKPGRIMVADEDFLTVWHDKDVDGKPYVRYGIAVGSRVATNANPDQQRDEYGRWTKGGAGVLYHGSPVEGLTELRPNKVGVVFLTPSHESASFHTPFVQGGGEVYHTRVELKKPKVISVTAFDNFTADPDKVRETKSKGYDSIVSKDGKSIAVFNPHEVIDRSKPYSTIKFPFGTKVKARGKEGVVDSHEGGVMRGIKFDDGSRAYVKLGEVTTNANPEGCNQYTGPGCSPSGTCYPDAYHLFRELKNKGESAALIHGQVTNPVTGKTFLHAWVAYGGRAFQGLDDKKGMDRKEYKKMMGAKAHAIYEDLHEVQLKMIKSGMHYGPWEESTTNKNSQGCNQYTGPGCFLTKSELEKVSEWREHLWNRGTVAKLAKRTVSGGDLSHLHPGEIVVYRGRSAGSLGSGPKSYTKSRAVAEKLAEGGRVEERKLTKDDAALDIEKALKGVPSKSEYEQEVFVANENSQGCNQYTGPNCSVPHEGKLSKFGKLYSRFMDHPGLRSLKGAGDFCKKKTVDLYNGMTKRYGKATAVAVLASAQVIGWGALGVGAAIGMPLYLPGVSLWGTLPALAVAESVKQVSGGVKKLKHTLTGNADMSALVTLFVNDLEAAFIDYLRKHRDEVKSADELLKALENKETVEGDIVLLREKPGREDLTSNSQARDEKGRWTTGEGTIHEYDAAVDRSIAEALGDKADASSVQDYKAAARHAIHKHGEWKSNKDEGEEQIKSAIRTVAAQYGTPKQANHGHCDEIANEVTDKLGHLGAKVGWGATDSDEYGEGGEFHSFVSYKGKHYDAENPEGVSHPSELNFFKRHGGLTANTRWQFHTTHQKVLQFQTWLKSQIKVKITSANEEALWKQYIERGYKKGVARSFDDSKKAHNATKSGWYKDKKGKLKFVPVDTTDFYKGKREQFLSSSFNHPVSVDTLKQLVSRTYTDLEGVTEVMAHHMRRTLADGLTQGKGAKAIANDLAENVDGIGKKRALLIARTELVRAHAEGQLDGMEHLGVTHVGAAVEWSTSGLNTVDKKGNLLSPCKLCKPLQGVVLRISEARGLIPRHVSCLCSWTPANVGEDEGDQVRDKEGIDSALEESGLDDVDISPSRPHSIFNRLTPFLEGLTDNEHQRSSYFADCPRDELGHCLPQGSKYVSSREELAKARKVALDKAANNPKPTKQELRENIAGVKKLGAQKFRRNLVGNSTDRAKRRAKLFEEFGDGHSCPCVYCGLRLKEGTLTQDKIITTEEGGRYRMPNIVPACDGCNKARGDAPWNAIKWS